MRGTYPGFRRLAQKPLLGYQSELTHPLAQGLIFHLPCLEGQGPPFDVAGRAAMAPTGYSSPAANVTWAPGKFGNAPTFNGTTQRLSSALASGMSGSFSVAAWVYCTAQAQSVQQAVCSEKAANYWWALGNGTGVASKWTFGLFDGVHNPLAQSAATSALNTWVHLVGVRDVAAGKTLLYVNGTLEGNPPDTTTSVPAYSVLSVGGQANIASRQFPGSIDDVRIYNRALTAAEAGTLAGFPGTTTQPPAVRRFFAPSGGTNVTGTDSAALAEASALVAAYTGADSATLAQAATIAAAILGSDGASLAESSSIAASYTGADAASVADVLSLAATIARGEAFGFGESATVTIGGGADTRVFPGNIYSTVRRSRNRPDPSLTIVRPR